MNYKYSHSTGCFYPDEIGYDNLPDDIVEINQEEFKRAMSRQAGEAFDVKDGVVRIIAVQPSAAHELNGADWVLNKEKQQTIIKLELANEKIKLADEARQNKLNQLSKIVVITASGKSFDGNETARINMLSAITASQVTGQTQAGWKLADNSVAMVSLDEIKEALALSIQRVSVTVTS